MGLNEKITEKFSVVTDLSGQSILNSIELGKQKQTWTDFLDVEAIDYKEINIKDNRIEITRSPGLFTAFRPSGKITIEITTETDSRTTLSCEVLPFNGLFPIYFGLLITFLIAWSLFALLFVLNVDALLLILFGWTVVGLSTSISFRFTKWHLYDYSKKVIRIITDKKKAIR